MAVGPPSTRMPAEVSLKEEVRILVAPSPSPDVIRAALDDPNRLTADGKRCPTCVKTLRGSFCAHCGERSLAERPHTVLSFLRASISNLLDADNRLFRSLSVLILQPGTLTRSFLRGNRKPYLGPIQIFAVINIAFVLLAVNVGPDTFRTPLRHHVGSSNFYHQQLAQRWVNASIGAPADWDYWEARAAQTSPGGSSSTGSSSTGSSPDDGSPDASSDQDTAASRLSAFEDIAARFDQQANRLSESLIFLFIPGLAFWLWALHRLVGRKRSIAGVEAGFLPHVVHATHMLAAILVVFVAVIGVMVGIIALDLAFGSQVTDIQFGIVGIFDLLIFLAEAVYLWFSFRTTWRIPRLRAAVASVSTVLVFFQLLLIYRAILFFIVFTTMAK